MDKNIKTKLVCWGAQCISKETECNIKNVLEM